MLDRIRNQLDDLPPAEQRVARLVLQQPALVVEAPVAQIAQLATVSQPTVIRFCRSVDCKGLSDFKRRLARSLVIGLPYVHTAVSENDSPQDIAGKVFDNALSSLLRARANVNQDTIARAIELLAGARRIEFYGVGNSGITAQDAQHKFFRLGPPCIAYSDAHVIGMSAALLGPADVVVIISSSGRTIDLLDAARLAHEVGAKVISITPGGTPLANASDLHLIADTLEDPDIYSPMTSRLVHLVLIDTLAVGLALRGGPPLAERLERAKRTLIPRRMSRSRS